MQPWNTNQTGWRMNKMANGEYKYSDPRRLFELWKELTGEDLLSEPLPERDPKKKDTGNNTKK